MTLDTLDYAFVARWQARRTRPSAIPDVAEPEPPHAVAEVAVADADDTDKVAFRDVVDDAPAPALPDPVTYAPDATSLSDRLLMTAQEQWECLADEVEVARRDGHRVIAVVGCESGEGRTTLIDCLAHTLRERGRDVVVLAAADDAATVDGARHDGGAAHDRRIVLVDAGVWFPPGPIRRQRLVQESVGCDAAILVRRADREPMAARATAIAALGMTVLGEVVTFASPVGDE